jgi:hypothetical protein
MEAFGYCTLLTHAMMIKVIHALIAIFTMHGLSMDSAITEPAMLRVFVADGVVRPSNERIRRVYVHRNISIICGTGS